MNLIFKKCSIEDLDDLIEISKSTFIHAFEKHNKPKDFKIYLNSAFNKEKIEEELMHPNSTFYFVYVKEQLIGYLKLNVKDAQNEPYEDALELERIYVQHQYQGRRFGEEMLFYVKAIAKSKKSSFIWLGVWSENKAAIRFYERHGFKIFDSHDFYLGNDLQKDILMRLDLI